MSKILKTHPKSVQSHKDLILQCLDDKDESIRLRALDLLYGMVRFIVYPLSFPHLQAPLFTTPKKNLRVRSSL